MGVWVWGVERPDRGFVECYTISQGLGAAFRREELDQLLDLAASGIVELRQAQDAAIAAALA